MPGHKFWIVWFVCAILSNLILGYVIYTRRRRGPRFSASDAVQILFQENFASGRSLENILTRLGDAHNCLKLIVTPDELWTTSPFPFDLFGYVYDLEHRILKQDILSVVEVKRPLTRRALLIEYRRMDGRAARLEITPRRYEEFKQALETGLNMV